MTYLASEMEKEFGFDFKEGVNRFTSFDSLCKSANLSFSQMVESLFSLKRRKYLPLSSRETNIEQFIDLVEANDLVSVRRLLERGINPDLAYDDGWTPLHQASFWGHVRVVSLLLEAGADFDRADDWGQTPLHEASQEGHYRVVRLLLRAGADPDRANRGGWTPLHRASFKGHIGVVRLLLEAGADPDRANKGGWTPLHQARERGFDEIIQLLTEASQRKE